MDKNDVGLSLSKKNILVTGVSRALGIGTAITRTLALSRLKQVQMLRYMGFRIMIKNYNILILR